MFLNEKCSFHRNIKNVSFKIQFKHYLFWQAFLDILENASHISLGI